ncbi:DISARM system helicase DrmA [Sphingopyxis sp. XHP0097]|uniref:DISARM system helicase DrmA n=1 Tax=Sphingopyxis jiangsuensis TaxID=2871171 RepID=A0ABS7MHW6_9SPHN|nr:DISARM system helicase DrmA [Sphingopyxis jiangsuensis]MBY4638361.1 DISARM system helicase DrmA [Sphingopyxis jiangsuensis]
MSEPASANSRDPSSWLLDDAKPVSSGFVLGFGISSADKIAISDDDWIVVTSNGQLASIGRIARVRRDLQELTIYLDRAASVEDGPDISTLGLDAAGGSVIRLGWEDFEKCLEAIGLDNVDDVRLISDPVHVREILEVSVRDDLLGPAGGPKEDIVDMSVRDRYLVGKLAPMNRGGILAGSPEPTSAADENGDLEDEHKAPIHEPGAEFSSVSGRVDAESDALDEVDTSSNQSLIPSSIGMTFCVAPGVDEITVEARWGRYERVPNDQHEYVKKRTNRDAGQEEEVKVRVWRRVPCGGPKSLSLADGPIKPLIVDPENEKVRIQGTARTNKDGERLVTLFLVNTQEEPEENKDGAWVFQPELKVYGSGPVFRRRPATEAFADDPERDRLALIYRNRLEFAVGHGVSVHGDVATEDRSKAVSIRTEVIPRQEIEVTETPGLEPDDRPAMRRMVEQGWLDMTNLASMDETGLREALSCLIDDHLAWIGEEEARLGSEIIGFDEPGQDVIERCRETNERLREGMERLFSDPAALEAFRFANRAMALQRIHSIYARARRRDATVELASFDVRKNRSWRAFQLAFLLLSLPSLADPMHADRTSQSNAFADLLWFPTGGGKTEAYLGVAAFAMAIRRLNPDLGGLDASRGLSVIMRYTLRLLTLQQFQRATALLCAMESIRKTEKAKWGAEPFTLGLWVGNRVTPGTTEVAKSALQKLRSDDFNKAGLASPAQLTSCPWCGSDIAPGRDITVDTDIGRTTIYCGDKHNQCEFSKGKSFEQPHPGLPVKVVDKEIYHRPPTMVIATVDKFAMMAWRPEVGNLFGHVSEECERHGLLWPGHKCGTGHQRSKALPRAAVVDVGKVRPPDLIIQDEFHLISGPLGTMVGLYETAVDQLSSWSLEDKMVRPKVVASTATVRRADDQVRNVFMRKVSIFPPSGLDVEDNFFSKQRPIEEKAGRRYIGICAPGSSRPAVLIRVYTAFLTASQWLFERFGSVADPYMTLVGYFNSLRELGGMKRLAEDDVQTRAFRVAMSLVQRPGLAQRSLRQISELTSRVSGQEIPRYLDALDLTFKGRFDSAAGKWVEDWQKGDDRPTDVVLATNMLSVGVDVDRLGLMVVNGQPKGTAEYIQASSRVGRSAHGPGLVATVLTWARPRDLSHYESFEHYHSTFYQYVEAQSVTPFSPRAMDRGLTGTMLSILRHEYDVLRANESAGQMTSPSMAEMQSAIETIANRTWEVTEHRLRKMESEKEMKKRADEWSKEASVGGRTLVYDKRTQGGTEYQLLDEPGVEAWSTWTVPMSMREVEPGVGLVMSDDKTTFDPNWRAQKKKARSEDEA